MSGAVTAIAVAGTALSAYSQIQQGAAAKAQGQALQQQANFEADQRDTLAGQERATAQRRAIEESRQKRLVQSSAVAHSAASGAGVLDGSVVIVLGDLEEVGQHNSALALYQGEERARDLEAGAAINRFEGEQASIAGSNARRSGLIRAGSTALSGATSAYDRFKS